MHKSELQTSIQIFIGIMLFGTMIGNTVYAEQMQNDKWERKADMPTGRVALSVAEVNGKIYAIGGIAANGYSSVLEEYDPELDKWTKKADMPTGRCAHTSTVVNGKIYVIGGYNKQDSTLSVTEEYDPVNDSWETKTPMPSVKLYFSAEAVNGKIYVFGGWEDLEDLNNIVGSFSVYIYDPAFDEWTRLDDIPEMFAVAESTSVAVDDNVYFFGGINAKNFLPLRNVLVYNTTKQKWKQMEAQVVRRNLGVAEEVNGKIYFIGGEDPQQNYKGLANVEEYDVATDTIANMTEMPHRRGFTAGCAVDNRIYVIGGTTDWGKDLLSINEVYTPAGQITVNPQHGLSSTWGCIKFGQQ